MGHLARQGLLVVGLGIAGSLAGTACDESTGGIVLPPGNTAGQPSAGSSGMELGGEGGQTDPGGAGGVEGPEGGKSGSQTSSGGSHTHGSGGSNTGSGGTGGTGNAGTHPGTAGDDGDPDPVAGASGSGGEGGANEPGSGGTSSGGVAGTSGSGTGPLPNCIYHSDPVVDVPAGGTGGVGGVGGVGGAGGAAPSPHGVAVGSNAFVGPYLTDLAGFSLYIYTADFPGDCNSPPVSACTADCTQAWPVFNANERTLPSTLDPAAFGTLDRGDGTHQTTYHGWPLYYYKSDTAPNLLNGQGKGGKTWFAAEVVLPNLLIMRGPVSGGGVKYLGDGNGWTLYSLPGDQPASGGAPPVSNCTGTCLDAFTPFGSDDVFPCTSLEPNDVSVFLRADGAMQAAYKGVPLYYSNNDLRSGDELGVGVLGGALALP